MSHKFIAALHSEQNALVDFIVLLHAHRFVGVAMSTFSLTARDFRSAWNNRLSFVI